MSSDRLAQLEKFYEEDQNDPFTIYGLALEYLNLDVTKSKQLFDRLLTEHPDYIPTYYHAAKLYQDLNDKAKAIEIYEKGLKLTLMLNDLKTNRELQSAYQELIFE